MEAIYTELSVSALFSNLLGLFLLIAVGFAAVRFKILQPTASAPMSALLVNITLPATIFVSVVRPFDPSFLKDALITFGLGFGLIWLFAGIGFLMAPVFRVPEGRRGMWVLCCSFSNNGFMGFPVVYAIFGDDGLALAVMLNIAFTALVNVLGAQLVMLDSPKEGKGFSVSWKKILINPIHFAVLMGIIFYTLQISVPQAIHAPIQHLANVTTPLSMVVTGMSLAGSKLGDVVKDRDAVSASLMRLIFLPVVTWGILLILPIANALIVGVTLVIMSMPCAAIAVVLGEEHHGCTQLGARAIFLSSLACMATLPLIALLL